MRAGALVILVVAFVLAFAVPAKAAELQALFNKVHAMKRQLNHEIKTHPLHALKKKCFAHLGLMNKRLARFIKQIDNLKKHEQRTKDAIGRTEAKIAEVKKLIEASRKAHQRLLLAEGKELEEQMKLINLLITELKAMVQRKPRRKARVDPIVKLLEDLAASLKKRFEDLKNDRKTAILLQKLARLQAKLAELKKILANYRGQIAKAEAKLVAYKKDIAAYKKTCEKYASDLDAELKALAKKIALLEKIIALLQKVSAELKDTGSGNAKHDEDAVKKLVQVVIDKFTAQLNALVDPKKACDAKAAQLRDQIRALTETEKKLNKELAGLAKSIPALEQRIAALEKEINVLKGQAVSLTEQCEILRKNIKPDEAIAREIEAIQGVIALVKQLDAEDKLTDANAKAIDAVLDSIKINLEKALKAALDAAKKAYNQCKAKLDKLSNTIKSKLDLLAKLKKTLAEQKSRKVVAITELNMTKNQKGLKMKLLADHLNACAKLISEYKTKKAEIEEDLALLGQVGKLL